MKKYIAILLFFLINVSFSGEWALSLKSNMFLNNLEKNLVEASQSVVMSSNLITLPNTKVSATGEYCSSLVSLNSYFFNGLDYSCDLVADDVILEFHNLLNYEFVSSGGVSVGLQSKLSGGSSFKQIFVNNQLLSNQYSDVLQDISVTGQKGNIPLKLIITVKGPNKVVSDYKINCMDSVDFVVVVNSI